MSVYLKVLPAVFFDPDVLLVLGQKICLIVRDTLILDRRMEEICSAIEREGRTLNEVIDRITSAPFAAELDDAALACEKACSLLKTGIQLNLFLSDPDRRTQAFLLFNVIQTQGKYFHKNGYYSACRIRDIIVNLESDLMQQALISLNLDSFYTNLKEVFERFELIQRDSKTVQKEEAFPTLRSTISLYGMLVDSLIANVRFENYQLLHRVETVLSRIEAAVAEATETMVQRHKNLSDTMVYSVQESVLA